MSLVTFETALSRRAHHLSAFLMLGDPTPEVSVQLAVAAVTAGVTMLELGLPFSDPCADGPAIQASCLRARAAGVSTGVALDVLAAIHAAVPDVPLNLLVYGNLVHARGYGGFCRAAAQAGASTLLVPDVPLEEADPLRGEVAASGLGYVSLVGPLTDTQRLALLDEATTGFLYLAGYQGVTGQAEGGASDVLRGTVAKVKNAVCLGFGISTPEQIERAFDEGARMVVVGSHLARAIERALSSATKGDGDAVVRGFQEALAPLAAAVPETLPTEGETTC